MVPDPFRVVWGKSKAGDSSHLLFAHLLDTAAVAELIWDEYLASTVQNRLNDCADGLGRSLLVLVCGLHDVGKATPAFQSKDERLGQRVQEAGLAWRSLTGAQSWHHTVAGARIVQTVLDRTHAGKTTAQWLWPIIAGHHGCVPDADQLRLPSAEAHGRGAWPDVQRAFVERVAAEVGFDLERLAAVRRPSRAIQLALCGLVVMADWIASDEKNFNGINDLDLVSMASSRKRAATAWQKLGLRGGWHTSALQADPVAALVSRFSMMDTPRAFQLDVVKCAERVATAPLLIVEAPMGEGKTEAALAAAEVLARRFGADGVFVGMPTQATSDPMFTRVTDWVRKIDPSVPVALLHGRSRFNRDWADLREQTNFCGVTDDDFGMVDHYGTSSGEDRCTESGRAAAEWFLGNKRGLLSPVVIGTVDHLLYAATRTRHVMLRHAGLVNRVVILDEIHAYDIYMSQFLFEALRWLAEAGVPVVLLSATLPPAQRRALMRAYAQGATTNLEPEIDDDESAGYPRLTAVTAAGGTVTVETVASAAWLCSRRVVVEVLAEEEDFDPVVLAAAVAHTMRDGGRALVVCNTVDRAQAVYGHLRKELGDDVRLLHARLTAAVRAKRTEQLVGQLGPEKQRPPRLVIVATMVAEQSFDVDVDVLFSDLAPIDLLLQRIGRMHRHDRPDDERPLTMRRPRVVVSGVRYPGSTPDFPVGSRMIYGEHLLLRAAALVNEAEEGWRIPDQVPELVATGYSDEAIGPEGWQEDMAIARAADAASSADRQGAATQFLLGREEQLGEETTLRGLHNRRVAEADADDVSAAVRDGDKSIDVVLVRRDSTSYHTLDGRRMGVNGEMISDTTVLEAVAGSVVRLPARPAISIAACKQLTPLSGWAGDPWLRHTRALELPDGRPAELGGYHLTYDDELGLVVVRAQGGPG